MVSVFRYVIKIFHFITSILQLSAGKTILFLSVELELPVEFCRLLIKKGAKAVFEKNSSPLLAPIHLAIENNLIEHLKVLLGKDRHGDLNKVRSLNEIKGKINDNLYYDKNMIN